MIFQIFFFVEISTTMHTEAALTPTENPTSAARLTHQITTNTRKVGFTDSTEGGLILHSNKQIWTGLCSCKT